MQLNTKNGGDLLAENNQSIQHGRGRGLVLLGDLMPSNAGAGAGRFDAVPMERGTLADAARAGEYDALGLAQAAFEEQGAADLRLATNLADKLGARIESRGGKVSKESIRDGAAAGVAAVVAWRCGAVPSPVVTGERVADTVAVICWRAIVASVTSDGLGETLELSSVSESWLVASIEPLAVVALGLGESRSERASRWLCERAINRRRGQLESKVANLQAGQTSRRRDTLERIGMAARRMIGGDTFDAAAQAVGFKASDGQSAGDSLSRAARRCGLAFQFNLRQRGVDFAKPDFTA